MFHLEGKRVLVTGSSRGIGAGIAKYLAEQGCRVAITYTSNSSSAEKVLSDLHGDGHICLPLDVTQQESVQSAFSEVLEKFSGLDGLVNNAGITKDQLLLRMTSDDFNQVIQTNLTGAFLCTKAVLKAMIKNRGGSIVNITSVIGQMGNAGQSNYAASKAGIEAFSKSIAREVGSRGVRVNCIAPGFITTDMTEDMSDQQKQAILSSTALGSMGTVADIAHAAAFLVSDLSSYITGQTLSVNGGMHM